MHQRFEGSKQDGPFVKVTREMMASAAWRDLNLRQRGLYLTIKAKYTQKVIHGTVEHSNRDNISFTKREGLEDYGDYRTFQHDMQTLITHGFIRLIESGYRLRTCNIYGLTDAWVAWRPEKPPTRL
jgi:hypothetical protein